MKRIQLSLLIIVMLIAIAATADSLNKEIPTMTAGQQAQGAIYKADRYKSYHLLSVPTLDKKYLFITVTVDPIYQHLNVSLLIYKQGQQSPLQKCDKEEIDSCYIPRGILQTNQTLFVVVQCQSNYEITYKLMTYWSDLQHIVIDEEIRFMFSPQEQRQIYHLQLEGLDFKQLRILIKPETRRYPFDRVKMYGTFGKDSNPSSEHFDFQSLSLWEDAQGIYLFKQQLKDMTMNLILYGMTETVYTMKCELANKTHSELAINTKIYQYLQKSQRYIYHVEFKDKDGKYFYDDFVFRVSVFSGDLDFKFYQDQQKKKQITDFNPFMYMGDIQYLFRKPQIQQVMPNGLYVEAASGNRITTFMMEFQGRSASTALELHEHIYEFLPIEKTERAYFKVGRFGEEKKEVKSADLKVTVTQIEVAGRVGLSFLLCLKTQAQCIGENYLNFTKPIGSEIREVGSKKTHNLILNNDMFSNVNSVEQQATIIVVMANKQAEGSSFLAVEYNIGNRPEYLRENKPIEAHVAKQELKIYKYVCQDPAVKKVLIHINTVAGLIQAYSFRKVPTETQLNNQAGRVTNGLVEVTDNLMQDPIVIVITGTFSSTFSIVLQPITTSKEELSFITLSQDVQFKAKIAPNQFQIFEIVPISASVFFSYKATGAVHVCLLDDNSVCKQEGTVPTLANNGDVKIQQFYDRKAYVKVRNPSSERIVELYTIFHSKKEDHCQLIKVGELAREVLSEGKCLYTVLHSLEDYQIMIVHEEYGKFLYSMLLCDKVITFSHKQNQQERYYISKDTLKNQCQGHSEYTFSLYTIGDPSHLQGGKVVNPANIVIKYIVQPVNAIAMLPDGVGYKGVARSSELPIKKFAYKLLNKIDTTIVVSTRSKAYFLVKVVEGIYRDKVTMSGNDFHFSSPTNKYYFLESLFLTIPGSQLFKNTCNDCELLIFLYSKEPVGQTIEYNIEVVQNFVMLEEGKRKQNYLTQYSKAFYGYKAKTKGMIYVELSDNNLNCAELYISNKEYPDENNYLKRSYDGELMLDNSKEDPTTYYVTVTARQNCAYSIGANLATGQRNLFKLERGVLSSLSLKEGEVKYFTFKHISDSPFKILSLHKYGSVQFYLNQTTSQEVVKFMTQSTIRYEEFQYRSEHKNRLLINSTSKYFCKDCLYILAVFANKHTESSLYLGDEMTKIPLTQEKVLNDILPVAGSATQAQFYPIPEGVLNVKVHSGKIEVKISYKDQQIREVFEKKVGVVSRNFTFNVDKSYFGTSTIMVKALQINTVYSLTATSIKKQYESESDTEYTTINPDEASYIFISERKSCLKGYIKAKSDRLFLSFYSSDKEKLKELQIKGTLNSSATDVSHDLTRNVISVSFIKAANMEITKGIPYQLCLSIQNDTLSAVVMQSEDTGTLPQNVEMLVTGKQTYDIYPEGQFLLDVFQCRGAASIAYGSSRSELESKKEKILDVVGISDQTHAVKIDRGYFNMLLRINSPLALVRWLPIKEEEEKGIGYYLYSAGSLKYDSVFGEIQFQVQPLKAQKKKTKTTISDIKYNLYISNSEEDLKEASLCERYLPESVMEYRTVHEQIITRSFKFSINKNKIMQKFNKAQPDNLFAVIVADLTLQTPDKSQEYYRFVYNQQEIPAALFEPTKLQEYELIFLIVFLVILTLTLLTCAWLCTKVFVPMIGRLRNRMLVEQGGLDSSKDNKDDMKQENLEPPPSSDRQNINALSGPETEARMS